MIFFSILLWNVFNLLVNMIFILIQIINTTDRIEIVGWKSLWWSNNRAKLSLLQIDEGTGPDFSAKCNVAGHWGQTEKVDLPDREYHTALLCSPWSFLNFSSVFIICLDFICSVGSSKDSSIIGLDGWCCVVLDCVLLCRVALYCVTWGWSQNAGGEGWELKASTKTKTKLEIAVASNQCTGR